jgi:hypothetical protein
VDAPRPLPGWLVGASLLLLLVPIWAFSYFPSQDGPVHVENARILLDYGRPDQPALSTFYERSAEPVPNWFSHLLLSALLQVVGPRSADKIFLSLYVLALPFAFRYALNAFRPDAGASRMLLVLPFVYNHFLHLGFYNLAFSAVPFFLVLGFWLRHEGRLEPRAGAVLALLLAGLYFCHLVTLFLAFAALGVLALARSLGDRHPRPVLFLAAASLPSLVLSAWFLASRGEVRHEPGPSAYVRFWELLRLKELVSFDMREAWVSTALGVALLGAAAWLVLDKARRHATVRGDALLLVVAACTLVYFTARTTLLRSPSGSFGGGTTHDRVSLWVFLCLVLWIAVQPLSPRAERALVALSVAATLGLLVLRWPRYAELDDHLLEYASAGRALPRDAVLLPVSFAPEGLGEDGNPISLRVLPFLHAASWIAAERGVIDLLNYEADLGYFPVRFRPEANPYRLLRWGLETRPPCVSLNRYDRLGPRPLDFILLWGYREADRAHPCGLAILQHLDERYELVFTSAPRGLARLYRRKAPLNDPSAPR